MKETRFKTQFNPNYKGTPNREKNHSPSETVPDQSLSIKQLLLNHTRRTPSPHMADLGGQYLDTEVPHIEDLNDVAELRESLQGRQLDLEEVIAQEKAEAKRKAEEAAKQKAKAELFDETNKEAK